MIRLPAEWEPQSAVMLTWPRDDGPFAPRYEAVADCFFALAEAICAQAELIVSFHSAEQSHRCLPRLAHLDNLSHYCAPNNDVWARDHGPISIRRDDVPVLLDFQFDGWGGKFSAELDNALSARLHAAGAFGQRPLQQIPIVLEGGAIDSDGQGTLMATRRSVLDPQRNPGISLDELEDRLSKWLGIERWLWLEHGGLDGDDTDGHIDTLARFCNPQTIVYQGADDTSDPNYRELTAMQQELTAFRRADGKAYRLLALPSAGVHRDEEGQLLPASYANFLILNQAVLMPGYGVAADETARQVLATAFPEHDIVVVDCQELIRQYGSLHCVTMNIPA